MNHDNFALDLEHPKLSTITEALLSLSAVHKAQKQVQLLSKNFHLHIGNLSTLELKAVRAEFQDHL